MTNNNFVMDVVARSNWAPGRLVDISNELAALGREGYKPFPAAVKFLSEYSGVTFPGDDSVDDVLISSVEATAGITFERVQEDYSPRAKVYLVPVGLAENMDLTLLMGEDGRWYGGFDNEFGLIGLDFIDALGRIILNEGFIERM